MKDIKFSVIIPVYNAEKYLIQCVDSVLNQTFKNFEIILVDDGSTDNSGKMCDTLANSDKRIKVIHKNNAGEISARITGLRDAVGMYILFLDSDDMIRPDSLEFLLKQFEKFDCDMLLFNASKEETYTQKYNTMSLVPGKKYENEELSEIYNLAVGTGNLNSMCLKATKREIVKACYNNFEQYFWIRNGADAFMSFEIVDRIKSAVYIDEIFYFYRTNYQSITMNYNDVFYNSIKELNLKRRKYSQKWFNEIKQKVYDHNLYACFEAIKYELTEINLPIKFHYKKIKLIFNDDFFVSSLKNATMDTFKKIDRITLKILVHFNFFAVFLMLIYRIKRKFN